MFPSKFPHQETTIFTVMSALARQHDAWNLSQGFPDFSPDEQLVELVYKAMRDGHNQYAPMPGHAGLREVVAEKHNTAYACALKGDSDVTITSGATQALFTAIAALVHPGEEVIYFEPAYDCYRPAVESVGGIPRPLSLESPTFEIDWAAFGDCLNERTRMVVVNTPNNPGCFTWTADDWAQLEQFVAGKPIVVLSDEVYEHLVFDAHGHQSVLSRPALAEQRLAVFSFGKNFHMTGWKLGYAAGATALMHEFRKLHQYVVFAANHPMQEALFHFLQTPENYLGLSAFYERKYRLFSEGVEASAFDIIPAGGSFFVLADYSRVSDLPDRAFTEWLTVEHGIATIPLSPFYERAPKDQRLVRFCFAKSDDYLAKAAEAIRSVPRA